MKKEAYIQFKNLSISERLFKFVNNEILPGTKISSSNFWSGFSKTVHKLSKKNKKLLEKREDLQIKINSYNKRIKGKKFQIKDYERYLYKIGYLIKKGKNFKINVKNVDDEISKICGPQLVCPVSNSRFILNAANARWVSLYDSLYGSDVIESEESVSERYDPERGHEVRKYSKNFLDKFFPLNKNIHWKNVQNIKVEEGKLCLITYDSKCFLKNAKKFVGYRGEKNNPSAIILKNNNLHLEIIINPKAFSAKSDPAGISDIILESAITTICDNEDSVAAVDSTDKVDCYRNWLGLMKKNLTSKFNKSGKIYYRKLNPDRKYFTPKGKQLKLYGRSLLLNRNVGHLMTNPSILLKDGSEVPEGIMDAYITSAVCIHDLKLKYNSRKGSIYIVKPKMHGPEEASFANLVFSKVEETLKLKKYTIKCGIMDEERRTSVNLKETIRALKNRVFFINTGFLDRTGDEIHTSMEAGPMIRKGDMKFTKWISAYENNNVEVGLECGFSGIAQIGKGMWAMPDKMKDMMTQKISHLQAGANCAWVPSPTAAGLHAMHYHKIDIFEKHRLLKKRKPINQLDLLNIPIAKKADWSIDEINSELANSCQTILGYVVRWIDQGIGCSKVPDIKNIGLMEDRATLRISSQHITNWLHHGICSRKRVLEMLKKMARVVDEQNKNDNKYQKMSPNFDKSIAFKTACELIFQGRHQPSGYTEPLLHLNRLIKKN